MFVDDPKADEFDKYGCVYMPMTKIYQESTTALLSVAPTYQDQENIKFQNLRAKKRLERLNNQTILSTLLC
tara:strand:+ start:13389 stop:13601 length:213 start_codon:yes stop_codon:yes gene_type:complete